MVYQVQVENTGSITDSFTLNLVDNEWDTITVPESSLILDPNQIMTVDIVVSIPNVGVQMGQMDTVLFTIASQATDEEIFSRYLETSVSSNDYSENPTPILTEIDPNSAVAGGAGFTLTVSGEDFIEDSAVLWNGQERATDFINPTQLQALINAADIASAGENTITVFSPEPGGGVSNSLNFTVYSDTPPGFKIFLPLIIY